jgi:tRNA(Arg) A34 adenosine deaminase TadA
MHQHDEFLREAIAESKKSVDAGGFPVGCVIVEDGKIVARGVSNGKQLVDPTSHAETDAIRALCKSRRTRFLKNCTLYSSCEPCLMCLASSVWARIPRIVFACERKNIPSNYFESNLSIESFLETVKHPLQVEFVSKIEAKALEVINEFEGQVV